MIAIIKKFFFYFFSPGNEKSAIMTLNILKWQSRVDNEDLILT